MKKLTAIVIGAGSRGASYAQHMKKMDNKFDIVAVADAIKERCENIQRVCNIPDEDCYASWEEILSKPKMADLAIIATMDDMHYEPAMKAIELGYHLLLEKPVAQSIRECMEIAEAAKKKGVQVLVCHVLRYTPFFKTVKELLMDGTIGEVISLLQVEAVGNIHQSHSFVRGDWHDESETTPMILAKCCHDLDMIQWLIDKPCEKVSSFGELTYFKPENAPEGAPRRCIDGGCPVEETCPYSCKKVYLSEDSVYWMRRSAGRGFSKDFVPNDGEVLEGLKNTNFGACVFYADNNVVDHQVVNMQFEGGVTASLTMNGFNKGGRYIRIFGTKGELYANASDAEITVYSFESKKSYIVSVMKTEESIAGGHGGGDFGIVEELYDYLSGQYNGYCAANIDVSVKNHLIGFAAEEARHENRVVNMKEFTKKHKMEL